MKSFDSQPAPDNAIPPLAALSAANTISQQIIASAQEGIIVSDRDLRCILWNPFMEEITGVPAAEVLGKHLEEVFPSFPGQDLKNLVARAMAGETVMTPDVCLPLPRKGGAGWSAARLGPLRDAQGQVIGLISLVHDLTARKQAEEALRLDESRLDALWRLAQMELASLSEITHFALEEAIRLTKSTIGYLAFANEDETVLTMYAWSQQAMQECAIRDKPLVYPVAQTGLWGEAVRQRKPVITNDYAAAHPAKKGTPAGHVPIHRHLNLPVFDHQRIVAVAGVGNKAEPYDASDVRQLTLMMDGMWNLVQRQRATEALKASEARYRTLAEASHDSIFIIDRFDTVQYVNSFAARQFQLAPAELIGRLRAQLFPRGIAEHQGANLRKVFESGQALYVEDSTAFIGRETWLGTWLVPIKDDTGAVNAVLGTSRDITQRKQAERELFHSRQMLQLVLDHIPQRVFWKGRDCRYLGCNQSFAHDAGVADPSAIVGRDDFELAWKETAPRYRTDDMAVMQSDTARLNYEEPQSRPDGSQYWLRTSKMPLHDSEGQVMGVMGIYEDITESRRAQAVLRLQSSALESAANGIVITDRQGAVVWANVAFTHLTGYALEEIQGQNLRRLKSGKQDAAFYQQLWNTISTGGVWRGELVNRRQDGVLYTEEMTVTPVRDPQGEISHFIAIKQDVSARIEMEQELRQSRRRFALIFQSSPAAIGISTLADDRYLDVNHSFLKLLGLAREEVIGHTAAELGLWAKPEQRAGLAQLLTTQTSVHNHEIHLRAKSGQTLETLVSVELIQLGLEACLVFIITDITERKRLEAQLRQAQKMESIGTLAGGVAHDFNNLLTIILGHTNLAMMEETMSPKAAESLRLVIEAAERAANLTRQLLTFSRKQPMAPRLLDLNEAVGSLTKMLRRIIGEDVALECKYSPHLPPILADMGMIEQIIFNLAVNARDAMPAGGRLILSTHCAQVDAAHVRRQPFAREGQFVCFCLRDTGVGIPAEVLPHIFEPFFTTKEVGKGTGLGLATVHGIVQQHQGWIEVESEVNSGSAFHVYLPVASVPLAAAAAPPPPPPVPGGTETILLVEDETELRTLGRQILQQQGYRVLEAATGWAALQVWEEHAGAVDLLLTDLIMPQGMNGRQLAERLRAKKPGLKVLYTSGYTAEITGKELGQEDGAGFLQKPYPPLSLAQVVRQCLDEAAPK